MCDAPELRSSLGPTDLVLSIWGFGTGLNSREMVDPVCYIRNAHEYDAHCLLTIEIAEEDPSSTLPRTPPFI